MIPQIAQISFSLNGVHGTACGYEEDALHAVEPSEKQTSLGILQFITLLRQTVRLTNLAHVSSLFI